MLAGTLSTHDASPGAERRARRWKLARRVGRLALLALGAGAVIFLVIDAGPGEVWRTLLGAGAWLPLIALLDIAVASVDVISVRVMHGPSARGVPFRVWLRSALVAHSVMVFLPTGRAGGEVIRAASLARYVGGARATAAAALIQGVAGCGNALISIPCYVACASAAGPLSLLAILVAANGIVSGVLGTILLLGARSSRVGGWLGRRVRMLAAHGASFDESLRTMPTLLPIAGALGGRLIQAVQYGVLLLAVGGALTPGSALVAHSIHLVGAGMLPNQTGFTETAFRLLGDSLPLHDVEAQAIAIALLHRIVQFGLGGTGALVGALWQPAEERAAKLA